MRRLYSGPVFYDGGSENPTYFHYGIGLFGRRIRLVSIDGRYYRARRGDPSHQARYHIRDARVTP